MKSKLQSIAASISILVFLVAGLFLHSVILPSGSKFKLTDAYWLGEYADGVSGKRYFLGHFCRDSTGTHFVTIDDAGRAIIYALESDDTHSEDFRYLTFSQLGGPLRISGKQLYENKRYFLGRLMVGRFTDFWCRNDDETIGGELAAEGFEADIRFQKIEEGELSFHWSNLVPWGSSHHTNHEIADEFAFFLEKARDNIANRPN